MCKNILDLGADGAGVGPWENMSGMTYRRIKEIQENK